MLIPLHRLKKTFEFLIGECDITCSSTDVYMYIIYYDSSLFKITLTGPVGKWISGVFTISLFPVFLQD